MKKLYAFRGLYHSSGAEIEYRDVYNKRNSQDDTLIMDNIMVASNMYYA